MFLFFISQWFLLAWPVGPQPVRPAASSHQEDAQDSQKTTRRLPRVSLDSQAQDSQETSRRFFPIVSDKRKSYNEMITRGPSKQQVVYFQLFKLHHLRLPSKPSAQCNENFKVWKATGIMLSCDPSTYPRSPSLGLMKVSHDSYIRDPPLSCLL